MIIRIVSLNLWLGGVLFDNVLSFLKEQDADIVLLQEVFSSADASLKPQYRSVQALQEQLRYPHQDFVADFRDFDYTNGKAQRGNAILSRLPITVRNAVFFDGPYSETYRDVPGKFHTCPRDLQHVVLNTPVGEVNVFNIQGVWEMDGDHYSPQRARMCETVLAAIKDKPNVILAGDTNATPGNQAIKNIEKKLTNVFGNELKSTFNMRHKHKPGYATSVVDMIFVSPEIVVVSRDCPDVDVSDHLPVVAGLEVVGVPEVVAAPPLVAVTD